ncbi:MAG: bifunctional phosphopantothenoylcysteine decarboxylase/phosphopantothenate--cysteine ligase CoaBC [Anaerolineae bacterium]
MKIFIDKNIILCVSGSIAAYKAATLASQLYQAGACVQVAMTRAATHFITPLTLESITHRPVVLDVLALGANSTIEHVTLAHEAHLVLIAPATANTIARLAHGLADDAVSAIVLDTRAPIVIAPAMETGMWENPATQENLARLRARGMTIIEPGSGHLASGATGQGRLAEPDRILAVLRTILARHESLAGKKVVITAGGTHEPIDPVRMITNHSSGKMGFALAEEALERGAQVELITTVESGAPIGCKVTPVSTTQDLYDAVIERTRDTDLLIMAAAPADYRPRQSASHKIKKDQSEALTLELVRNPDVLGAIADRRQADPASCPRVVVGFAAETDNLIANARDKLERKRLDLIVANPVPQTFGSNRVKAILLDTAGDIIELDPMPKEHLAAIILDRVEPLLR